MSGQRCWFTGNGGFSTAFNLNRAYEAAGSDVEFFHIDGKSNPTDTASRASIDGWRKVQVLRATLPALAECHHPYTVQRKLAWM